MIAVRFKSRVKLSTSILLFGFLTSPLIGCRSTANAPTQQPAAEEPEDAKPDAATVEKDSMSTPVDPASDATHASMPVIVCFGDSLTAGYGTEAGQSYPDVLQRDLDAAGFKYHVINQGISGDTTKDGLARVNRVLAAKPAIVVVEFGGNDGLRGLPIATSRANMDAIMAALKPSGAKVTLAGITLPPQFGKDYIAQFNQTYTVLAKKYDVPLLPFLYKDVYGIPGMIQSDGIHATAQGNIVVAKNVMGLVKPLLKK